MSRYCPIMLGVLMATGVCSAQGQMRTYVIDTEGGKAMLVIGPSGRSMLVDAGFPGFQDRDAMRIEQLAKTNGIERLDYLVVTHYDMDHLDNVPAVVSRIPVETFVDHGEPGVQDSHTRDSFQAYQQLAAKARRMIVKPGDRIPLDGIDIFVVSAAGRLIDRPVDGNGQPNPYCQSTSPRSWTGTNEDLSENAQSVGLLFRFGRFRMLDLADLTWNKELELVCPANKIGQVDVFMVSHHGHQISNSPALVHAIRPTVAILNNGARKFGFPAAMEVIRSAPGLKAFYQLHWSVPAGQLNSPDELIANLQTGTDGNWILVTAQQDGTFTVINGRTGVARTFSSRS